jgi:hypothetical protein
MEYNLHRDFNASFAIDFKRYTTTSDLQDAVDRYITSQGNQAGLQNLAEILYNMAFNYTPSIAHDLMPQIIGIVKHNGSQAGMQAVKPVLNAIFEEALTGDSLAECKDLVERFVEQNDSQTGLPILYEIDGETKSVTFGWFLKQAIELLSA